MGVFQGAMLVIAGDVVGANDAGDLGEGAVQRGCLRR